MFKTSNDLTEVFVVKFVVNISCLVTQEKANLTLSYTNGEAGNGTVFVTVPLFFQMPILFAAVFFQLQAYSICFWMRTSGISH